MLRALPVFILLLLRVQSIDLYAPSFSSLSDFDLPEIDGSAVDTCRIFSDSRPDPTTAATTPTTPITKKQVVVTTKRPAVQTPPSKPETKSSKTPIRPQPAPSGPITDGHANAAASLLYQLLANSRRRAAGHLQRFNSFLSQPMGRPPQSTSESDETAAALLKRAGQTDANRWKIRSFSSEDSSDES